MIYGIPKNLQNHVIRLNTDHVSSPVVVISGFSGLEGFEMNFPIENKKRIHKKPSYRFAIAWIAENDEAGSSQACDHEIVTTYISTLLVAGLFGCDPNLVAADIVSYRLKNL